MQARNAPSECSPVGQYRSCPTLAVQRAAQNDGSDDDGHFPAARGVALPGTMITLAHISDVHLAPLPPVRWFELANKRVTGYLNWRLRRHNTLSGDGPADARRAICASRTPTSSPSPATWSTWGSKREANSAFNWLQTVGEPLRGLRFARQSRRLSARLLAINNER